MDPQALLASVLREIQGLRAELALARGEVARLTKELEAIKAGAQAADPPKDTIHKVGEALGPHAARFIADLFKGEGQ